MEMNRKFGFFLENYGTPFFVGSLVTKKIIFVNKQASTLFGVTVDDCDLGVIFDKSPEQVHAFLVHSLLEEGGTLLYNYTLMTKEKKKLLVDLQVGYFNNEKTELYLEIIPQHDTRMEMALHQIKQSPRAEAILNLDDRLSIVGCNDPFHKVFESCEELGHSPFKNDLVRRFLPEIRENLRSDIHKTLETSENFSTELKVFTATGEETWYRFDLQKRELDNIGTKLMCYMVNIEKQVQLQESHTLMNQYLGAMQEFTENILYRVDAKTKVLTHTLDSDIGRRLGREISDYPEVFIKEKIIHPDDSKKYLDYLRTFYSDNNNQCEECVIRIAIFGKAYQWYTIIGKKIFDHEGNLVEVLGALVNVTKAVTMQKEVSVLNQYLDAFQAVSHESFAVIDLVKKTLTQKGPVAKELGVEGVLEHFPECTFDYTHPDDLHKFKIFSEKSVMGETIRVQARMKATQGEYQWYEICSKGIPDHKGKVTQLVGKIANIHKEKNMQNEFTEMNKYFEALQTFSSDVLYRIDTKTMTLYHSFQSERATLMGNVIPDYLNTLLREVVHPEDAANYIRSNEAWMLDESVETSVRFALITDEYQWYRVKGKKIFDKDGNLSEVVGVLMNIDKEKNMENEVSLLTQYFETMQSLSNESIYVFDLETRLLHIGGLTETELGLPVIVEGYPESLFSITHPEDLDNFKSFAGRALNTKESRTELRFQNTDGSYQWYELISNVIYGKTHTPLKLLGKIRNIEKEKIIQEEASAMTKYFDVMQEFSSDILYRIDVPTQTLYHAYQSEQALRVGLVVPNYLETIVNQEIVHPEDAEEYITSSKAWLLDDSVECEVRFNLIHENYALYSIKRRKIYDDNGNLVEILGALVSVQKEHDLVKAHENSTKYFKIMQELSEDILYRVDVETMTLHHNFESQQEITKKKAIPDYVNTFIQEKVVHPDDVEQYLKDLQAFNEGDLTDISVRFALISEEYHWYKARGRKIFDDDGNVVEFWGRLMSEQKVKEAQQELTATSQQFNAMQKLSDDILFQIDIATKTFHHNEVNSLKYGFPNTIPNFAEFFIKNGFVMPEDAVLYRENTEKLLRLKISSFETRLLVEGNVYDWHELRCEPLCVEGGTVTQLFGRLRNIQSQRNLEERAYHDLMTGALNKVSFEEESATVLHTSLISNNTEKHALIFIDLDDFKGVNDTLGHSYGDALLTTVGKRLKRLVRGDDLVGRIGGDEFAVLLRNIDTVDSVLIRTNLMLESLQRNFSFEKKVIGIKASVGVAVYPQHGTNYKELIGRADMAVYESKRRGKNVVSMYTPDLEQY